MVSVLRDAVKEVGGSCILVTHNTLVAKKADRILTIQDGKIIS